MELSLYQYKNGLQLENRYNWRPDAEQWWITGFDPATMNPKNLVSIGKIDFSRNREMGSQVYNKLRKETFADVIWDKDGQLWIMWR